MPINFSSEIRGFSSLMLSMQIWITKSTIPNATLTLSSGFKWFGGKLVAYHQDEQCEIKIKLESVVREVHGY